MECSTLGRPSLILLLSLLFEGREDCLVLLPWGSWEVDGGEVRSEGRIKVSAEGTTYLPEYWMSSRNESPSHFPFPLAQVGSPVGGPGVQGLAWGPG